MNKKITVRFVCIPEFKGEMSREDKLKCHAFCREIISYMKVRCAEFEKEINKLEEMIKKDNEVNKNVIS